MNPSKGQFETREDRNAREYAGFQVEMHTDGKSILRRPGTTGSEGILPRDIPMNAIPRPTERKKK